MAGSVHAASRNHMQVFENTRKVFSLRSKRSAVRIRPGVPVFYRLAASLKGACGTPGKHPRLPDNGWCRVNGQIDFVRFVEQFRKWCPQGLRHLEVITGRRPAHGSHSNFAGVTLLSLG